MPWLPLFIPTLALGLGIPSHAEDAPLSTAYLWISLGLIVAWALAGWLGALDDNNAGLVAGLVAVGVTVGFAGVAAFGVAVGMAVGVAVVVAGGVAFCVAGSVAFGVAGAVAGGMAFSVAGVVAIIVAVGVAFVVAFGVEDSLETDRPSWPAWLTQGAFGALLLAHAFLVWFSFLGGWRVFQ